MFELRESCAARRPVPASGLATRGEMTARPPPAILRCPLPLLLLPRFLPRCCFSSCPTAAAASRFLLLLLLRLRFSISL